MGKTLESIFVSEFNRAISNIGYKDIYKVPLPPESSKWYVSGTDVYAVKGITIPYYEKLNKTLVRRVPKGFTVRRRVIDKATRSFAMEDDGSYKYEDFPKPANSVVVISNVKISLPYSDYRKKVSKDGYGYVDFIDKGTGAVEYLYVLPKSVLYKVNQTALALSVKNMKNYSGCGYITWKSGTIFLHIIPYKPDSQYIGSKILKTGHTLNYSKEVECIVSYWQEVGLIPNIPLCTLSDGTNLVTKGTAVGYDSYMPVETLALSDKLVYGSEVEDS